MSRDASVTFDWADGTYRFRLAIGQVRELQEKTGVGPYRLFDRMVRRDWFLDDIRETIRLGLIGGGTEPASALGLVRRYVDERPLAESVPAALLIVSALLHGAADETVGKAPAPQEAAGQPTTDASASPTSTGPAS